MTRWCTAGARGCSGSESLCADGLASCRSRALVFPERPLLDALCTAAQRTDDTDRVSRPVCCDGADGFAWRRWVLPAFGSSRRERAQPRHCSSSAGSVRTVQAHYSGRLQTRHVLLICFLVCCDYRQGRSGACTAASQDALSHAMRGKSGLRSSVERAAGPEKRVLSSCGSGLEGTLVGNAPTPVPGDSTACGCCVVGDDSSQ